MEYTLISDEEYASLPADDDECFLAFEAIVHRNMALLLDDPHADAFEDAIRERYMQAVAAIARELHVPNVVAEDPEEAATVYRYGRFVVAVQTQIARIRVRRRHRSDPLSVLVQPNTRISIRFHVGRLRSAIEASEDLPKSKKSKLEERLSEFESELNNRRLSFGKAMSVLSAVLVGLGSATTIAAEGRTAVTSIMRLIGHDRAKEDAALAILAPPQKALPAPTTTLMAQTPPDGQEPADINLDDEIPF